MKIFRYSRVLVSLVILTVVLSGCLFKAKDDGILSYKRPYEPINLNKHESYNDPDMVKLTDGVLGNNEVSDPSFAGWNAGDAEQPSYFIIDLGATKNIATVKAHLFHGQWGINAPKKIYVSVSDDKTTWTDPIYYDVPNEHWDPELSGASPGGAWYTIQSKASGRYVKLGFEEFGWVWISEAQVLADK